MKSKVLQYIQSTNMIQPHETIILGLSGGADSCVLTHLLKQISEYMPLTLIAVHVHHGLRGAESDEDEKFVQKFCEAMGIKVFCFRYDIKAYATRHKISLEEAGRAIRYQCFEQVRVEQQGQKIAVAHHKNDQAETLLMRFFRGTGLKGLGGMAPVHHQIIRPLLAVDRDEILQYCQTFGVTYRTDMSNESTIFTRNKIRLEMIPTIQQDYNPNIVQNLSSAATLFHAEDEFLETMAQQQYAQCVTKEQDAISIQLSVFQALDPVLRWRILRLALQNFVPALKDVTFQHIEAMDALSSKENGKKIMLPHRVVAVKKYGFLSIGYEIKNDGFSYTLPLEKTTHIGEIGCKVRISLAPIKLSNKFLNIYTKTFSYDKIEDVIQFRSRKPGDRLFIKGIGGHKKLKEFFIDEKIPQQERAKIPLLAVGQNILLLMGKINKTSALYDVTPNTKKILYFALWEEFDGRKDSCDDWCGGDR